MEGECEGLLKTRREGRNKSVPRTVGVSARVSARVFVEWSSLACVCAVTSICVRVFTLTHAHVHIFKEHYYQVIWILFPSLSCAFTHSSFQQQQPPIPQVSKLCVCV